VQLEADLFFPRVMFRKEVDNHTLMTLSELLKGITVQKLFQTMYGQMVVTHDVEVHALQYDSRKVERGDMFVAIRGSVSDGHKFISQAIANGAKVVVMEDDTVLPDAYFMHTGTVKVVVPNSRAALARMSDRYYGFPSERLTMIGVTGTNGKTTTTSLVRWLLEASGKTCGLIGTIECILGKETIPATHTTPESLETNQLLARMLENQCTAAVMEVSSHALHQHRADGLRFDVAVFTNLTQDHLDYHHTMEEYFDAKKILFENLPPSSTAVINLDDPWGGKMRAATRATCLTFGMNSEADLRATNVSLSMRGAQFTVVHGNQETAVQSPFIGKFNVSNALAMFGVGIALGIPRATIAGALSAAPPVRGRFECIASPAGWTAVIDYAHTPDALQKALLAVHEVLDPAHRSRVITVFGCGGNRDRTKRPLMAAIASELSTTVVVTSDNPRHENPEAIIDEVMKGIKPGTEVRREPDRKKAIDVALSLAQRGDVVLIAGKGHEDYQIIDDQKIHFSDREVVEEWLHRMS